MYPGMMHFHHDGPFGIVWLFMMLLNGLFWLSMISGAILLLRRHRDPTAIPRDLRPALLPPPSPLEMVRERYARGEIDTDQLEEQIGWLLAEDPAYHMRSGPLSDV